MGKNRPGKSKRRRAKKALLAAAQKAALDIKPEKMPSVDQLEMAKVGPITPLPSTIEIFDKYKTDCDDKSDSEESFHLPMLDEDEPENKSPVCNGSEKDNSSQNGETEDDILNKFETSHAETPDNLDSKIEDSILDEADEAHAAQKDNDSSTYESCCSKDSMEDLKDNNKEVQGTKKEENKPSSKSTLQVVSEYKTVTQSSGIKSLGVLDKYEASNDSGEFISIYESENINKETTESNSEEMDCEEMKLIITTDGKLKEDNSYVELEKSDDIDDFQIVDEDEDMETETTEVSNDKNNEDSRQKEEDNTKENKEDVEAEKEIPEENKEDEKMQVEDEKIEKEDTCVPEKDNTIQKEKINKDEDVLMEEEQSTSVAEEETNQSTKTVEDIDDSEQKESDTQDNNKDSESTVQLCDDKDKDNSPEGPAKEGVEEKNTEKDKEDTECSQVNDVSENEDKGDEDSSAQLDTEEKLPEPTASSTEESAVDSVKDKEETQSVIKDSNGTKEPAKDEEIEDVLLKELDQSINAPSSKTNDSFDLLSKSSASNKKSKKTLKDKDENVFSKPEEVKKAPDPPEKCEVSNDSSKNQDNDEDLLDISIIRDTEEDDACAIASAMEDNTTEAPSSERSDNDDENRSEVTEAEKDDSEAEKDDRYDDNEPMDYDDTSNMESCDQDTGTEMMTSDSESKSTDNVTENKDKATKNVSDVELASDKGVDSGISSDKSDENSSENSSESGAVLKAGDNSDSDLVSKNSETDENKTVAAVTKDVEDVADVTPDVAEVTEKKGSKRSLSQNDIDTETSLKKRKISCDNKVPQPKTITPSVKEIKEHIKPKETKVKSLTDFEIFMQNRKMKNGLTRSDLEQFCIQKICETIMLKSNDGELHQTIKKQEKIIEGLRKDLQQLNKQAKDLEIVNKKLMSELKLQNSQSAVNKKPLVPLRITRSVGLQVRLNVINEANNTVVRRRQAGPVTPQKSTVGTPSTPGSTGTANASSTVINRNRTTGVPNTAVRQVMSSPQKTPTTTTTPANSTTATTPLLSQALQNRARAPGTGGVAAKRTTQINRTKSNNSDTPKTSVNKTSNSNPSAGVIDLTDEDDRTKVTTTTTTTTPQTVKILNKNVAGQIVQNKGSAGGNKVVGKASPANAGNKASPVAKVGTPARTVTTLPQGVRLTPQQMKGGIAIPVSSAGTTQLMYVVPTIASSANGAQKLTFVNLQPSNGVLPTTLNTTALNKSTGNTLTLRTVNSLTAPRKHPAPLPTPPRVVLDHKHKPLLPKPHLTIRKTDTGIILQWKMPYNLDMYESIASYQLYAYQETNSPPSTDMWRKVGDVKALALPMACTLTQFADKNKYYFAVRSVDVHKRIGAFSDPEEISL